MNITAATRFPDGVLLVSCDEGELSVPPVAGNRHYDALMAWVGAGGALESAEQAPSIPQIVSRFQARAALHLAGLLPSVETLMADPNTDMLARLAWTDAREFRRDSPTIASMSATLGITEQQLDDLFVMAATIDA